MSKNRKLWLKVTFALVGAIGGFVYWKIIGCSTGMCPVKSVWYFPTLWGMAMGYVLGDLLSEFIFRRACENE